MKICSRVISCNSYLHGYHYYASEFMLMATFSGTLFAHGSLHNWSPHLTFNKVHCLEWSHFYCCMCLTTWKIDLPTSPGVLLRYLSKILLDGSKALQAAQKRTWNDEDEFVHESIRTYVPWYVFALLASAKVRVTYVHGQTLASISHSRNSHAQASI